MLPTSAALVPIFERLLQVKLNRVDELVCTPFYHHLVTAEIGGCQKLEALRYVVQLQAMVLPNAQDARALCEVR